MGFYGKATSLHKSDKHVLHTYNSCFYEYSPESISKKYLVEPDKNESRKCNDLLKERFKI